MAGRNILYSRWGGMVSHGETVGFGGRKGTFCGAKPYLLQGERAPVGKALKPSGLRWNGGKPPMVNDFDG